METTSANLTVAGPSGGPCTVTLLGSRVSASTEATFASTEATSDRTPFVPTEEPMLAEARYAVAAFKTYRVHPAWRVFFGGLAARSATSGVAR